MKMLKYGFLCFMEFFFNLAIFVLFIFANDQTLGVKKIVGLKIFSYCYFMFIKMLKYGFHCSSTFFFI